MVEEGPLPSPAERERLRRSRVPRDLSPEEEERLARRRGFLGRWVERRAEKAIRSAVSSGAETLEERAIQVVGSLYDSKADDLEDRAVRALRRAIADESERIRSVVEASVEVKKREVRLSLLVLVGASIVYLVLYWLTQLPVE